MLNGNVEKSRQRRSLALPERLARPGVAVLPPSGSQQVWTDPSERPSGHAFLNIPSRCKVNRSYGGYVPHGVNDSTAPECICHGRDEAVGKGFTPPAFSLRKCAPYKGEAKYDKEAVL